jgi:hypothetical protein
LRSLLFKLVIRNIILHSYLHSSAKYYIQGDQGIYAISNFMEMEDLDLSGN